MPDPDWNEPPLRAVTVEVALQPELDEPLDEVVDAAVVVAGGTDDVVAVVAVEALVAEVEAEEVVACALTQAAGHAVP